MWRFLRASLLILLVAVSLQPNRTVLAAPGVPGSAEFGYGAAVHLGGDQYEQALSLAVALQPDWLTLTVPWDLLEPAKGHPSAAWEALDQAFQRSAGIQTPVLVRLTSVPRWALASRGPSQAATITLIGELTSRYGSTLQAIELFPGANTTAGWGTQPDPAAYARLFSQVHKALVGQPVLLVAGGLQPVAPKADPGEMDDLAFLRGLYGAGLAVEMPVISLQLPDPQGEPLAAPDPNNPFLLRHYEQVRQVMVEAGHMDGRIWITLLKAPSGTINPALSQENKLEMQAAWLRQAALQIRSQLYIGMTVFHSLNSDLPNGPALIAGDTELHPFYPILKAFIAQNLTEADKGKPGRPKDTLLTKTKP